MNVSSCTPCLQKCATLHSGKPTPFNKAFSFFLRISGAFSLQDKLFLYLPKLASFCCSSRVILRGQEHFWSVDLNEVSHAPSNKRQLFNTTEDYEILIFTHIEGCYFSFRIFSSLGLERKSSDNLKGTCACCHQSSLRTHRSEIEVYKRASPFTTRFSLILNRFAVGSYGYRLYLPSSVYKCEPFVSHEDLIITVHRKDDYAKEWKLHYRKRYGHGTLTGEWRDLVRKNDLKVGDECIFTLVSKGKMTFTLDFVKGCRENYERITRGGRALKEISVER